MTLKHLILALALTSAATLAHAQNPSTLALPTVPTTRILAMGHFVATSDAAKARPIMQQEVPATLRLYLDGKIDQWYIRNDGKGVVFLLNCSTVEEAHALLEKLPLGVAGLMEFDLIPLGPLSPLSSLLQPKPAAAK